jgi:ABC-type multidrug transport system permease subunit
MTPTSSLVLGKVIAGAAAADLAGLLLFSVARLGGWLPSLAWGYGLLSLAVMTLFGIFGAAVGVALATRVRGLEQVNLLSFVVSLYLFFLTGGIAAVQYLPSWLRGTAHFVPNMYATDALRDTLLYGTASGVGLDLVVLAVAGVMMLGIAVPAMRRSLAH